MTGAEAVGDGRVELSWSEASGRPSGAFGGRCLLSRAEEEISTPWTAHCSLLCSGLLSRFFSPSIGRTSSPLRAQLVLNRLEWGERQPGGSDLDSGLPWRLSRILTLFVFPVSCALQRSRERTTTHSDRGGVAATLLDELETERLATSESWMSLELLDSHSEP